MQPQLFRIDDRLIHGQVVLGWAKPLNSKFILLCDEVIASSDWEKDLYLSCVADGLSALVFGVDDTCTYLQNPNNELDKTIVLVKSPQVVFDLIAGGFKPDSINIGGLHFMGTRKEYLPYVFMDQKEIKDLNRLIKKNIQIYCQDVPTGKKYMIQDIISQ